MNKRIKELAEQVGVTISGYTDNNSGYYEPSGASSEELEKFAELIVQECATYAFSDDQDRRAMLKHFGVEE
jgi:hypothetical protein